VQAFVVALQRELERFVAERATERGYSLLAAPAVTIAAESALSTGVFTVRAKVIDAAPPPPGAAGASPGARPQSLWEGEAYAARPAAEEGRTRPMRPLEMPLGPSGFESLFLAGTVNGRRLTWPLAGKRVRIGRGLDNEVVLDDASVSRHHAEIVREEGGAEVRDLGSTNGTWLNAGRVDVAPVEPGDQIAVGAVHLEVTRRPDP